MIKRGKKMHRQIKSLNINKLKINLHLILKVGTAVATVNTVANEHYVLLICSEEKIFRFVKGKLKQRLL